MTTPANNSGLVIVADRLRGGAFTVRIGEEDLDDSLITAGDIVYVMIGRGNKTPLLQFDSNDPATGSTCTLANPTQITFDPAELDFPAGIYDIEVGILDHGDADRVKKAECGVFHLRESLGGTVA